MIALVLARKNLTCLIFNHNLFMCKSSVSFALSPHFFGTSRKGRSFTNTEIYDLLLHKHQFSHEVALLAASKVDRSKSPKTAESVLTFLKESGCSSAQLEKIVKYDARILSASVEDINFKFKIIQDLGFSSKEVAKMISNYQVILHLSAENKIIPALALLNGLLGSDYDVARVLRRSQWVLSTDLRKTLIPNIEFLKSCGIPMERIHWVLLRHPMCLLVKPDVMRKFVDKAKEMGVSPSSNTFVRAVLTISSMGEGTWEVKLQGFQNMGFTERDILTMFQKAPQVFTTVAEKAENIKELLLATGKFSISNIVGHPESLGCSIEKRLKPRLQILEILESKNLIKKWPSLGRIRVLTDDKFFDLFVRPYPNELAEVTKCFGKDKRDFELQSSS